MPELPEVETIRRQLGPAVTGKTIESLGFSDKHLRKPVPKKQLLGALPGSKITEVKRRGKYLLIGTNSPIQLVLHLGMSGKLNFDQKPSREKHCHFWCVFKEGGALSFIDPRRFGQLECFEDPHGDEASPIKNLGPEPFNFDLKIFKQKMAKTGRSIKDFLLDQSQIAGLGNIYVCEALFLSGIDPRKKASQKTAKAKELLKNIELVLEKGIKNSGTSFSSYRDLTNFKGLNEAQLLVFRREGLPCPSCETEIIRIKQGGRSSFLCPSCQN